MAKNKSLIKKTKNPQQFHLLDFSQTTQVFYSKTYRTIQHAHSITFLLLSLYLRLQI